MAVSVPPITSEHTRQFREDGFFVLSGILPPGDLDMLRGECQRVIEAREREMDRLGVDKLDLDHRGSRYFLHAYDNSPQSSASCPQSSWRRSPRRRSGTPSTCSTSSTS
jgi:hypothetical protein